MPSCWPLCRCLSVRLWLRFLISGIVVVMTPCRIKGHLHLEQELVLHNCFIEPMSSVPTQACNLHTTLKLQYSSQVLPVRASPSNKHAQSSGGHRQKRSQAGYEQDEEGPLDAGIDCRVRRPLYCHHWHQPRVPKALREESMQPAIHKQVCLKDPEAQVPLAPEPSKGLCLQASILPFS